MPRKSGAPTAPFTGPRKRGPRTPEGKLRSSMNAFKTGKYARSFFTLRKEDIEPYQALVDSLVRRFQPQDDVEYRAVCQLALVEFRLDRVLGLDTAIIDRECTIQSAALKNLSPDAVPHPVAIGIATHNLLEHSKLPNYLAAREFQLLSERTMLLQYLEKIRKNHPIGVLSRQTFVPIQLNPANSFSNEFETTSSPKPAIHGAPEPAGDSPVHPLPVHLPEAA